MDPGSGRNGHDLRFDKLARDVGVVLEQHAYDRLTSERRDRLEALLFEFLYVTPGMEDVEQRLNAGVARPLRTLAPSKEVSSADCCATAHELRVLRPVQLAVVAAIGDDGNLYLGTAADEGPLLDDLTERVLTAIERACMTDGEIVENAVHMVPLRGRAS
jgi:hypothetical protein